MYSRSVSAVVVAAVLAGAVPLLSSVPARAAGSNPGQTVDTTMEATALAQTLVGPGVEISNVVYTGAGDARGTFLFTDATVAGMGQGVILSSGNAHDVVGPNTSDSLSTDWTNAGDDDLTGLAGYPTFDAAVLEFDFVPAANQVTFQYAFASDEYSEYVNTPFNDVFAFFINGQNCAQVRQVAGDPNAPFVPVAVNNINDSNPTQDPPPPAVRPDLFRNNAFDPNGPSLLDLEPDGITRVITCQSAVNPGVSNHMKLAIADASDGILDSAVFIEAGSLVSNENPTADLGLDPSSGVAPLLVTATVEGHDPNDLPLTYTIDWGDGATTAGQALPDLTATATHTYEFGGEYIVVLTVSNGTLSGVDDDDVHVTGPPPPSTTTTTTVAESTTTTTTIVEPTTTTTVETTTTTTVAETTTTTTAPETTTTTTPPETTTTTTVTTTTDVPVTTTTTVTTTTDVPVTTTTTLLPPCGAVPATGCRLTQPRASSLVLKSDPTGAKSVLKWKWAKGDATDVAAFLDPVAGTAVYRVCLYDASAAPQPRMLLAVPPDGTCGKASCWRATKTTGFTYADKAGTASGVTSMKLTAGVAGKAKVQVNGKGVSLPVPALPLTLPMTMQLVIGDDPTAGCWQTTFTTAAKNDGVQVSAKGP